MQKHAIDMRLPEHVELIIKTLEEAGFEAYAVGGCVRDSLLGREPEDWDITTSALPPEIKNTFRRTVDTGIEHGTVTVMMKNEGGGLSGYEVTTYRVDGEYRDSRHPDSVIFTASLEEDLKRRDFTINAMAYRPSTGLVDLFGGLQDLAEKTIRTVGLPDERFNEDALRILRAVRFAAQLGFTIEEETLAAIRRHAERLSRISRERIYSELTKLLCGKYPERAELLRTTGMLPFMAEGLEQSDGRALSVFSGMEIPHAKRYLRFAAWLKELDAETVEKVFRELKSDRDTMDRTALLAPRIGKPVPADRYEVKKVMGLITPGLFEDLLFLKRSFLAAGQGVPGEDVSLLTELSEDILRKGEPVSLKDLAVTGQDLIAAGVKPGPGMGLLLEELLDLVRREPEKNTAAVLLAEAAKRQQ